MTGRDSNSLGMGVACETDMGDMAPNLHARMDPSYPTIAQILREEGHGTIATGKWHLGPYDEFDPDGDKIHWSSGKGFDKNYNFLLSQTSQWEPGSMILGDEYILPPEPYILLIKHLSHILINIKDNLMRSSVPF